MAGVEIFDGREDPGAFERFKAWHGRNKNGFVVNLKTSSRGMLHRPDCLHLGAVDEWLPEWGDLMKKPKVCHTNRSALEAWASAEGITLDICGSCWP